ncbi:MAG: hypothetical protein JWP75_1681 [Frondihabitans sp.]|nr:hypothetical protein [Frondihabitans sp.]
MTEQEERAATSPHILRRMNAETVLRYALARGVFNASDVIKSTGLTRSTVIGLCDDLIELGWIGRLDDARLAGEYSKGRPARRYELHSRSGLVVGIDAGQHSVTVVVADLRGAVLSRINEAFTGDGLDPVHRLEVTEAAVAQALAGANATREAVQTTVIGLPAPIDERGHSPVGDDGYWTRMNPEFATAFADHGRVIVENDANLAAIAEQAIGAGSGTTSFAALLAGERFGAGLIVDGSLLHGRHGGAGEMRALDLVEGVGSAHGLAATAREWAHDAQAAGTLPAVSPLAQLSSNSITAEDVFTAAAASDPTALDIVRRLGSRLARVCLVLASLLDVERVIIVGAIAVAAGPVIDEARIVLDDFYPPVPEIVASTLGADAVVFGAIQRGLALIRSSPLSFVPLASPERTSK